MDKSKKTKSNAKRTIGKSDTSLDVPNLEIQPSLASLYDMLREQIRHEDNLVNQRLTWLLAVEAFLFTGFAVILTSQVLSEFQKDVIAFIISGFGIAFCFISWLSIHAAFISLKILREKWNEQPIGNQQIKEAWSSAREKYPPITYVGKGLMKAGSAAYGTPTLIIFAWVSLSLLIIMTMWSSQPSITTIATHVPTISTPTAIATTIPTPTP